MIEDTYKVICAMQHFVLIAPAPTPRSATLAAALTKRTSNAPPTAPSISTDKHTSHSLIGHTTKSSIQINATSAPSPSQTDSNDGTDVVLPTRASSAASAGPPVERISNRMTTGTVVGVIVVVIAVVISLLLIALFVFRKKR